MPPLGLAIIAALTPDTWEVEIFDENFKKFELQPADLVGVSALTSQASRAYEIAEEYKGTKTPTIIGGIHASMLPGEAGEHYDAVLIGEAESIWKDVIRDVENNSLRKEYKGTLIPLSESPSPRIDLFDTRYSLGGIQTTRGCPMKCDFCSVHAINGRKYRYRPVDMVVEEFLRIPQDRVYIVDDDFYGYSKLSAQRTKEFSKKIIESGCQKTWYTFTSMHIANDPEALNLMARAGCKLILLGIESEVTGQLTDSNKSTNLKVGIDNFEKVYAEIHKAGIAVLGSFIFGLDTDTPETILNRADYYINSGVDCIQAGILTPLPGTGTYYRMLKEKRILTKDWDKYTFFNAVIRPKNMSPEELNELMMDAWERIYDEKVMKMKYLKTLKSTKDPVAAGWAYSANINYRNTIFEGIKPPLSFTKLYEQISSLTVKYL